MAFLNKINQKGKIPQWKRFQPAYGFLFRPGKMPGKKTAEFSHTKGQIISKANFEDFI